MKEMLARVDLTPSTALVMLGLLAFFIVVAVASLKNNNVDQHR